MNKEKIIIGSVMIFIGTLALLVTTPKEGFEIIQPVAIIAMIILGAYMSYNAIYGN